MKNQKLTRVVDVMKHNFNLIDGKMTVQEALKTMAHKETKAFIIEKRDDDDEYGIVLLSDIAKQVLAKDRPPERVNIYEIMSKPVISVLPDMDIRYCARLFEQFGISRAPVIDNKSLLGIVSYTDMILRGWLEES